ncbi:hypothetical protein [uncultured Corynebacterium sp.]|uniref:hypothetical protein n=1 Tax=uncultured Corynebacterium sp. TaxID=159447 RepID=UPI00338E122C
MTSSGAARSSLSGWWCSWRVPAFAALSTSAGLLITGLRASGAPEEITGQLAVVFAEAAKWSLYASVVALAMGLISATVVRRKGAEQG